MPPVLLLVIATAAWAGNFLVGDHVVGAVGPLSLTWLRWVLAAVPLLVLAQLLERPDWRAVLSRWRTLLGLGLLGITGYPLLLYVALDHTTVVNAAVFNALNPAAIVVLAVLLGHERAGWRTWAGVGVGLLGVLVVLTEGDLGRLLALHFNVGDLVMLAAVVTWGVYTVLGRRVALPPLTSTALQVGLATALLTPFALGAGLTIPADAQTWWGLAFIVVAPSVIAYLCWNKAVPRVPSGIAGTSMNLITVFVMVISALLGQPPTVVQVVGAVLVIGGVLLAAPRRAAQ